MELPRGQTEAEKLWIEIETLKKSLKETPNDRQILHIVAEKMRKYAALRLEEGFLESDESYV